MSDNPKPVAADIDALLQTTWLQVISLRHGPVFQEGDGKALWERCVAEAERVQHALSESGMDETCREHILYAQCALLDEVVKGRKVEDDACARWYGMPLQGHFFGSLDAGDALCARMRDVLRDPAADPAVLTCFHRVMLLGFLGEYPSLDAPERERLVRALTARVPPLRYPQSQAVLAGVKSGYRLTGWMTAWPLQTAFSVLLLTGLWWGLDRWLDQILATLLPGVVK